MVKNHMKRINAPKTWTIVRKNNKFVVRPDPGAHKLENCVSLKTALTEMLKIATTKKEVKNMLENKMVLVDQKARKKCSFQVGLMDVLTLPLIKKNFRFIFDKKNKIIPIEIEEKESFTKPVKIKSKKLHKKKYHYGTTDGRTIVTEKKEYMIGDTLLIELPNQKILDHLKLEKNNIGYLISGKHVGKVGKILEIEGDIIKFKCPEGEFKTKKDYFFVIGKEKPIIKIENEPTRK